MTKEEKAAQEAEAKAEAEAKEAEFEASLEGLSEEEKAQKIAENEVALSKNNTEEIQKALETERLKRVEAEKKLEETRRKAKERFEKKKEETDDIDDDKPLTRKEMQSLLEEQRESTRKEIQEEQAKEIALKLSDSELEAELVLETWKSRNLAGSLSEQLEEAHAIATYKRSQRKTEELKRALSGKDKETFNLNSQRKPALGSEPKLNPVDKQVLQGYVWDAARGAYKKTIAGGKKIFYVSRDLEKRWLENA